MSLTNPARESKPSERNRASAGNERYQRFTNKHKGVCSFGEAGLELLADAIHAVTREGDLFSVGKTSDGGAWVVSVYSNGVRYPQYAHDADELRDVLTRLVEAAGGR